MKLFAVFAAVLAVAASSYSPVSMWTLVEIEAALQDPSTDPAAIPYLIDGLNTIVANLYAGAEQPTVVLSMPVEETVTLEELTTAIHDPSTNPAVLPYYENALEDLMVAMINGQEEETIVLTIPAMNVNVWTLDQLSAALENPETDPELQIYLNYALNELMTEMFAGGQVESIAVITPPGVIASVVPETLPIPVIVEPEIESPVIPDPQPVIEVPKPVIEAPQPVAETPVVASAPLVQLIVNVNAKQEETVIPTSVIRPTPVVQPAPVISEDGPHIAVGPWA